MYPSFGEMGYWHLIENAPDGEPHSRADVLWKIYSDWHEQPSAKWPIPPPVVKALGLELAANFAASGVPLPEALMRLLAASMELPEALLTDPATFFTSPPIGGVHPQQWPANWQCGLIGNTGFAISLGWPSTPSASRLRR